MLENCFPPPRSEISRDATVKIYVAEIAFPKTQISNFKTVQQTLDNYCQS